MPPYPNIGDIFSPVAIDNLIIVVETYNSSPVSFRQFRTLKLTMFGTVTPWTTLRTILRWVSSLRKGSWGLRIYGMGFVGLHESRLKELFCRIGYRVCSVCSSTEVALDRIVGLSGAYEVKGVFVDKYVGLWAVIVRSLSYTNILCANRAF